LKMLLVAMGNQVRNGDKYWAEPWIAKAKEVGLLTEGDFISFRNDFTQFIMREYMAMFIVRALNEEYPENWKDYDTIILDAESISRGYDVCKVYSKGIITGYPDKRFGPRDNMTRAEAATVIIRYLMPEKRKVPSLEIKAKVKAEPDPEFEAFINSEESQQYTSSYRFKAKDGLLVFRSPSGGERILLDVKFKEINKIAYELVKALVPHAKKYGHYVTVIAAPDGLAVKYFPTYVMGFKRGDEDYGFFNVYLEINPIIRYGRSEIGQKREHAVYWKINRLFDDEYVMSKGQEWFKASNYTKDEFKEALKLAFKAVYGDELYKKLFEYAYNEYVADRKEMIVNNKDRVYQKVLNYGGYEITINNPKGEHQGSQYWFSTSLKD